jgi:hypothetical protein
MKTKTLVLVLLFFIGIFAVGMLVFEDYGIPCDESTENFILAANAEYIVRNLLPITWSESLLGNETLTIDLDTYIERDHGQAAYYPIAPVALLHRQDLVDTDTLYRVRHIYTFIICYLAIICLYATVRNLTAQRRYAVAAVFLALLSPRFFPEYFYNNKDMVAFALSLMMIWAAQRFLRRETFKSAALIGFTSALAINTRLITAIFPILFVACYLGRFISTGQLSKKNLLLSLTYFLAAVVAYYVITPAAWKHPVEYAGYVLGESAHFSRILGNTYFEGKLYYIPGEKLPWYYLPKSLAITTPLFILATAVIGFVTSLIKSIRGPDDSQPSRGDYQFAVICGGFTLISIIIPIIANSLVYNSWRHLFFSYAGILILSAFGLRALLSFRSKPVLIITLLCSVMYTGLTAHWMIVNHPYQYVYFNYLAEKPFDEYYDTDYWSVAHNSLIQRLFKRELGDEPITLVKLDGYGVQIDQAPDYLLSESDKKRLRIISVEYLYDVDLSKGKFYLPVNVMYTKRFERLGEIIPVDGNLNSYSSLELEDEIVVDGMALQRLYRLSDENLAYLKAHYGEVMTKVVVNFSCRIDGQLNFFRAFNFQAYNYISLYNAMEILSGSKSPFSAKIDQKKKTVRITSSKVRSMPKPYVDKQENSVAEDVTRCDGWSFYMDGKIVKIEAYTSQDGIYVKLRDLAAAVGFEVELDTGVVINTLKSS